ncbi:hypothetical protein PtoMrB4_21330 [Metapseudomonas otitidis]|uniref:Uncharacterized protein n=1 Tax=Metapseudomonas otitidis TaxID=319939 RepID=A0A679GBT5_9GAMM|nr:hypothetical protein PtoMrB4_21330 [Pseudomonas otitidis]
MVTISVYSSACWDSWRRKKRQCRSVQSIIGATEKRRDSAGRVVTGVELDSRGIWGRLISARFTPFPLVLGPRSLQVASQIRRVANRAMGTITSRKRKDGSVGCTAQIRIWREGHAVYQESRVID